MLIDRSFREKIDKETLALNDTFDQMALTDVERAFHLKAAECTFFSIAHGTFSRIDHVLGLKTSLDKLKLKPHQTFFLTTTLYLQTHTHTHTHTQTMEHYPVMKKNEILPYAAMWMNLEGIMLSEISQRKTNTV